jgi:emfourin
MRIEVRRQGGYAGVRPPPIIIDTDALDAQHANELQRAAAALPASTPPAHGADLMRYDILVDGRRFTYNEPDVPPEARALLRLARGHA